jgi:GNAT superfamily N-acetyltransferase
VLTYVPRLDRDTVAEASRQTHAIWGAGRDLAEHEARTLEQLERGGPELLRYVGLVDDDGRLVASIKRYALALAVPASPAGVVPAVGIGAVFTRDDARRQGAATTLLRAVLGEARDLGYRAAWLYSDVAPAIYERLGFVSLPAWIHEALAAELPAQGALERRSITLDAPPVHAAGVDDVDRVLGWYEAAWDRRWLRPVRSRAALRYFGWRNGVRGAHLLHDGGREVGYVIAQPTEPSSGARRALWVEEWSAPGVPVARIFATFRAMAEASGAATVRGWLRPDTVALPFSRTRRADAWPMIAALDDSWSPQAVPGDHVHLGSLDHF